ncbi:uncharacterized protein (DUF849 family) [Bradyrhizobium sp. USDA 4369]
MLPKGLEAEVAFIRNAHVRAWREKNAAGEASYVFFGLSADVEEAHYLAELIDGAVRAELGRFKTSADYARFRHQERHLANASFALGMVTSIADRLVAMKKSRDQVNENAPAAAWSFSRRRSSTPSSTSSI